MEDRKIIALFFNRDEQAIKQIIKKYQNYCFSIARNILLDTRDIYEILNDTYLSLWDSIPPHNPDNLGTYIGKITRNKALDKYRQLKAKKRNDGFQEISITELEECLPDNSFKKDVDQLLLTKAINEFLATLSEEERNIFVCRYWYFDSIKDISSRYHYTDSKVKMSLKRSRDKLKERLIKEGFYEQKNS